MTPSWWDVRLASVTATGPLVDVQQHVIYETLRRVLDILAQVLAGGKHAPRDAMLADDVRAPALRVGQETPACFFQQLVYRYAGLGFGGHKSGFDLCATWMHNAGMPLTMTQRQPQKRERLVARVTADDKAVIAHAAALAGQSVGSFIVAEARKAALQTIETRERIVLNAEESRRFVAALLAPPRPPTERMKRSLKLYRQTVISDV